MATGLVINHGVSGYPCLGQTGDFQVQGRGQPWENIVNDPIKSYLNAQSHIGNPMSNFNEPWKGGELQDWNFNGQPYRTPVFGEAMTESTANQMSSIQVAKIDYPTHLGLRYDQQLPIGRIHQDVKVPATDRQNLEWEEGMYNGSNQTFMPRTNVNTIPNSKFFQGSQVAAGVHPNNDLSGQATTGNQSRPDYKGPQAPFAKLPNGMTVGQFQQPDAPALWELAPPPDPQVLPGEGTAPLAPTAPAWW